MAKLTSVTPVPTTFDDIKAWYEAHMSPDVIDFDDPEVYKVYSEGRFAGIFQLTSPGAQKLFMKARPTSIIDIAALTSIYRPGPLAGHVDKLWLKHADVPYDWGHPLINDTLKETRGLMVFQESVMSLANKVAGFPLAETDEVRRAIMKRSLSKGEAAKQKMYELEAGFVAGCVKNGVPEPIAKKAYELVTYFSGYGFNKSHAIAYAIDSFWCAWLLTHFEEQWLSAYLEAMSNTPTGRAKAFAEVKALGYQIVPIDVNLAKLGWSVLPGKKLMPSMASCNGIGAGAVEELMAMRPITSIEQLLWREDGKWRPKKFTSRALGTLIKIRAFDSLGCVGPDKVFKSYRHMHEVLMGSYTEVVTRKRKGVEETVEVVREHLNLIKRSSKADPHEGRKAFYELARKLADTHDTEWTSRELAGHYADTFGTSDVTMMFDQRLFDRLTANDVVSIEDLEVGDTKLAWFVTVIASPKKGAPATAGSMRKTKNGKSYAQPFVTGATGKARRLNVWGGKELFPEYRLYVGEIERNDIGYSTAAWKVKAIA